MASASTRAAKIGSFNFKLLQKYCPFGDINLNTHNQCFPNSIKRVRGRGGITSSGGRQTGNFTGSESFYWGVGIIRPFSNVESNIPEIKHTAAMPKTKLLLGDFLKIVI